MQKKSQVKKSNYGRKPIAIDWNTVDKLLEAGCNGMQVAAHLGVHEDTLYHRTVSEHGVSFSTYSANCRAKGDSLLQAKQFHLAMKGDKTMLVWLGKNRLGQRDKGEFEHTHKMSWADAINSINPEPKLLNDTE